MRPMLRVWLLVCTGAPAAKDVDAPGPSGLEGVEKIGAGIMFV